MMMQRHALLANGSYDLPATAHGVLRVADPPEAGWVEEHVSRETPDSPATVVECPTCHSDGEPCPDCAFASRQAVSNG